MPEVATLSGTLVDLRPRTLLHFLGLTGKSGDLVAHGHDRRIVLRLDGGRVVGEDAVDTVVSLLRLGNGVFVFEERAEATGAGRPVADVLAEADRQVAAWEDVSQAVPSVGLVVRLRAGAGGGHLSGEAWDVVATIAGGAVSPAALADHLGWSHLRVCAAVKELVDGGRAELAPPTRRRRVMASRARAVLAKSEAKAWHAADRPLWPGAGGDLGRARTPWDDPGESD